MVDQRDKRMSGWYGVDLDRTLAEYHGQEGIGKPIAPIMSIVKRWLNEGKEVRIFTARASDPGQTAEIQDWLEKHNLPRLKVTNVKDHDMIRLLDDRAIGVRANEGVLLTEPGNRPRRLRVHAR